MHANFTKMFGTAGFHVSTGPGLCSHHRASRWVFVLKRNIFALFFPMLINSYRSLVRTYGPIDLCWLDRRIIGKNYLNCSSQLHFGFPSPNKFIFTHCFIITFRPHSQSCSGIFSYSYVAGRCTYQSVTADTQLSLLNCLFTFVCDNDDHPRY